MWYSLKNKDTGKTTKVKVDWGLSVKLLEDVLLNALNKQEGKIVFFKKGTNDIIPTNHTKIESITGMAGAYSEDEAHYVFDYLVVDFREIVSCQ